MTPGTAPWAPTEFDPERVVAEMQRRFPEACIWFGEFSGHYWALIRDWNGRRRLVEGDNPADLGHTLEAFRDRLATGRKDFRPVRPRVGVGPDGRWTGAAARLMPPTPQGVSRPAAPPVPRGGRHEASGQGGVVRRLVSSLVIVERGR